MMKTKYFPSLLILLSITVCYCLPFKVGFPDNAFGSLYFHFFHANIFHLAVNMIALWQFAPRPLTCVIAFVSATLASLLPFAGVSEPTYGLSAFLFAAYARKYVSWHLSPKWLILSNLFLAFIPHMNWRIHILSFVISYAFWHVYYRNRHTT